MKPSLIVFDGRKAFTSFGPDKGDLKEPGIIIAGKDPIACDVLGLALLKTVKTTDKIETESVWTKPMIRRAVELGLGVDKAGKIQIKDSGIREIETSKKFLEI